MRSIRNLVSRLRAARLRRRRAERGSALVTVILVILVLTVIGIGVAYMTQVEDRLSGNDRIEKAGFYAAEAGLRAGERAIGEVVTSPAVFNILLATVPGPTYQPPGYNATTDFMATLLVVNFGTSTTTFQDMPVFQSPPAGLVDTATYTLYVRNNQEDPTASATVDGDGAINLISVGQVTLPGGTGITKILEEQLAIALAGAEFGTQKGGNAGGTGSGTLD